jgi:hypothetical protein
VARRPPRQTSARADSDVAARDRPGKFWPASIGLTGTGFALDATTTFATGGNKPGGTVQISVDRRDAILTGGGTCGWMALTGTPADPFNNNVTSGLLLKLAYSP